MKGKYQTISLDRLHDPENPLRDDITQESVQDLTNSIKQIGIINPLVVKVKGKGFELIAGHRRLVAAGCAGLTEAPCIVVKAKGMKGEVIKLQENLVRDGINPIEWAKHLGYIKKEYKLENSKIAEMLGMSESWVGQHLLILQYPASLLEALGKGQISFSSARELVQIRDPQKREIYVGHAIKGGLTPTLAIRWRKEANRTPLSQQEGESEAGDGEAPSYQPQPFLCAVCATEIEPADTLTLTIHRKCQPQPPTKG